MYCVCMYVCVYVCMRVCMYVLCMYYVCMYVCMYVANSNSKISVSEPGSLTVILEVPFATYIHIYIHIPYHLMMGS
jgi:hypothetical protein